MSPNGRLPPIQYFGPKELLFAEEWDAHLTLPLQGLIPCYQSTLPKPIIFYLLQIHQFHLQNSSPDVQLLYKNDVISFQHSGKRFMKLEFRLWSDLQRNTRTLSNNSISNSATSFWYGTQLSKKHLTGKCVQGT